MLLTALTSAALGAGQSDYGDCMQHIDSDRTIAGCTRIIEDMGETNRNRRIAYDNRGTASYAKGNIDGAIADFTAAVKLNPKDAPAYDNRGTAWRAKGDLHRALADFNTAIKLNPNSAAAYNNRGNIWRESSELKRALADYSEAIRLDGNFALAYSNRAITWQESGDKDRAMTDYSAAIRLDSTDAASLRGRGFAYFEQGDFAAAVQDLLRANVLADQLQTDLWLFIARGRTGENGAIELAVNAGRSSGQDWPAPVIEFYLGRRSLQEMRAKAKNSLQTCETHFYVGEWHLLRGDLDGARAAFSLAVQLCEKTSKERAVSLAELKRLKPKFFVR